MPKLGPTQEAIRIMALHLPKAAPSMKPAAPMAAPAMTPESIVLKSLMAAQGHGQAESPAQGTTIEALLEGLTRGQT